MPDTYAQIYLHIVWSTWNRLPHLRPDVREHVYACIIAECRKLGTEVLAIGGTLDHVHILVRLPTTVSVACLVKQMKGSSSHLATHADFGAEGFKWQGGYAVFSVSKAVVPKVQDYIANQERHHAEGTTHRGAEIVWEERPPSPDAG